MQAFWALLLDLAACPGLAAPAALPPLAAALDVWPALVQGGSGSGGGAELASLHGALQHMCSQVEAAGEQSTGEGTGTPLLLERQPLAAAAFVRRLGRQHCGWADGAAGSAQAARDLQAARAAEGAADALAADADAAPSEPEVEEF